MTRMKRRRRREINLLTQKRNDFAGMIQQERADMKQNFRIRN